MYKVYILQSLKNIKYYVGHTKDLDNRLIRHNNGLVRATKHNRPWKAVYIECYITKQEAYKREMQIKSYKSGEAFKKLINKKLWVGTKAVNWSRL